MADQPATVRKEPFGRPPKYHPKFCRQIIKCCTEGLSISAFAAMIDVSRETIYAWERTHPDFSDAVKVARSKRQIFWERRLIESSDPAKEKLGGGVAALTIFALKNVAPEEFSDNQQHHHFISGTVKVERVERRIVDVSRPAEPLLIEGEVIEPDEVIDQAASEPPEDAQS